MPICFSFLYHPEQGVPGNTTHCAVEVTGMSPTVSREGGRDQKETMGLENGKDSDANLINLHAKSDHLQNKQKL